MPVAIRVNGAHTEWHGPDVVAVMHDRPDAVVVPRVETKEELGFVRNQTGLPVLAMIETAKGVLAAGSITREAAALIAGTNDLSADLRLPRGAGRAPLQLALQTIILAARAEGIAAFDGVYNQLDDLQGFAAEAEQGQMLGFDGKSLIHPGQIATANRAFTPSDEEVAAARRLVEASSGGAQRHEGRMIEQLHVDQARAVIARANRLPA